MSRLVVRNAFARHSIRSERIHGTGQTCAECGQIRLSRKGSAWLYQFNMDDDSGPRHSGPIGNGKLFCSRNCAEGYLGQPFDEVR